VPLPRYISLLRQQQPILLLPRQISELKQWLAKRTDSYFLLPFYNQLIKEIGLSPPARPSIHWRKMVKK
jgi:hypothetical protein